MEKPTISTSLVSIDFHDRSIQSWRDEQTDKVYVAMRRLVTDMGLDWKSQSAKLVNNPLLKLGIQREHITTDQGLRQVIGLDLDLVPAWLMSINAEKVREDLRETILLYQQECTRVLRDYWFTGKAERTLQPLHEVTPHQQALALIAEWAKIGAALADLSPAIRQLAMRDIQARTGIDMIPVPEPPLAPATTFQKSFTPIDANGNEIPDGMYYNMEADPVRRLVTNESWLSPMHFGMYLRLHGDNQGQTFNMMLGIIGWQKQNTAKVWIPTQLGTPHCRQRKYNLEWQVGPVKAELGHCKNVDDLFSTRPEFRNEVH